MNWLNALSSLWGGIKPYASDPNVWLGALGAAGTGLGVYDYYRQQSAESDYLDSQRDWQRQVQALAGAPLNIDPAAGRRLEELTSAPLDVESIFNPGKALIQRDIEAGLAQRGLQPGGAYLDAISEGMMRNYLNAAQVAQAHRNTQVQGAASRYEGGLRGALGQRQAAIAGMTGASPVRPQYGAGGDVGALGKYLASRQAQQREDAARSSQQGRWDELMSRLPATPNTTGMSFYPDTVVGDYAEDYQGGAF